MINVLVTGRTGFIGNHVIRRLSEFPENFRADSINVRDDAWRKAGFRGIDAVIHAAGIAHIRPDPSLEAEYMRVNRDLAIEIAKRAKSDGVRHFIFLSSIIVYGDAAPVGKAGMIDPETPPAPSGAYGRSKLEAEKGILALADDDFKVSVIRPPMVYGKGCKGNYNMLSALARRSPVFPSVQNSRSVLYVGNLAECIRIILKDGLGGIFYPQDEKILSTGELVQYIARAHGRKIHFLKCLAPLVRLAGKSGIVRRAFGDLAYDPAMSVRPENYRIYDPETAVRNTEIQ